LSGKALSLAENVDLIFRFDFLSGWQIFWLFVSFVVDSIVITVTSSL
jgi:hypothetical protein